MSHTGELLDSSVFSFLQSLQDYTTSRSSLGHTGDIREMGKKTFVLHWKTLGDTYFQGIRYSLSGRLEDN